VWCVGARTRFLMTRCTIPTFVNVFAGNLIYICICIYTTQCKLPECKCSICASGWMKKQRVSHHVC